MFDSIMQLITNCDQQKARFYSDILRGNYMQIGKIGVES